MKNNLKINDENIDISKINKDDFIFAEFDIIEQLGLEPLENNGEYGLTDAQFFKDHEGNIYTDFPYYQIKSFADDLLNQGEAILYNIENL